MRAFGESHLVVVVFHALEQSGALQILFYLFAHLEAVHANIQSACLGYCAVVVKDVYAFEVVLLSEHIVVNVVGRRYLQAACSEFLVHIIILNNGYDAVNERNDDALAFQPRIFLVGGIDTHGSVAHYCFRTCGGYHGVLLLSRL